MIMPDANKKNSYSNSTFQKSYSNNRNMIRSLEAPEWRKDMKSSLIISIIKSNAAYITPYACVIVLDIRYPGLSPLCLTFSQATGREHREVQNCHLFS